jgi:hypothetical protein
MKRTSLEILLILLITIYSNSINAQTTWTSVNSNLSTIDWTAKDGIFAGNITSNGTGTNSFVGNVGIGTTIPDGKLHVVGDIYTGATGDNLGLYLPSALGVAMPVNSVKSIIANASAASGYTSGSLLYQPRTGVNASHLFFTEGTVRLTLNSTFATFSGNITSNGTGVNSFAGDVDVTGAMDVTGSVTSTMRAKIGSLTSCSYGFDGDGNTGFYQETTNENVIKVASGGTYIGQFNASGLKLGTDKSIYFDNGSTYYLRESNGSFGSVSAWGKKASWAGYSIEDRVVFMHDGSNTAGIYDDVNNKYIFRGTFNGATELYYNGTSTLATTSSGIDVTGETLITGGLPRIFLDNTVYGTSIEAIGMTTAGDLRLGWSQPTITLRAGSVERLKVHSTGVDITGSIIASGNVGIGTTDPGNYKLAVEGTIGAREVTVTADSWSDFVFKDDYKLQSLNEVESFIKENKHLPDIPSEEEVKENGVSLGEMDAKLLQKIEELMLYVIRINKKVESLEAENIYYKKQNSINGEKLEL